MRAPTDAPGKGSLPVLGTDPETRNLLDALPVVLYKPYIPGAQVVALEVVRSGGDGGGRAHGLGPKRHATAMRRLPSEAPILYWGEQREGLDLSQ